jgi:hypothetical protein
MSGEFTARDTGPGSAAQGGEVHARDIAGRDTQTFNIHVPPPPPAGDDRQEWLVRIAHQTAIDVAVIRTTIINTENMAGELRRDVDHHGVVLFGNGNERAGLVERMRAAWRWLPVAVILAVVSIILSSAILLFIVFAMPGV